MIGRNYQSWRDKFFNNTLDSGCLYTLIDSDGLMVGFHLSEYHKIWYQGKQRFVLKLHVAVVPACRYSGLFRSVRHTFVKDMLKKYKGQTLDLFENVASPVSYGKLCNYFGKALRPRSNKQYLENDYAEHLIRHFSYKKPVENKNCIVSSISTVISGEYERSNDNKNKKLSV